MTVEDLRVRFPHVERSVYLNHAATAPLSTDVMQAIHRYLDQRHESLIENYQDFQPVLRSARSRLAALLGTSIDRVEFAPNTSYALNVLAQGLDWQEGDRVAVPSCEFPANVYPFLNLRRMGVEVDFIPHEDGAVSPEAVERALLPDTRLLSMSWVQFLSGFRSNVRVVGELCKERGVLFCVDAIQGLGALQLNVEDAGIDFLASGGHKWLMATQGIGFLYVTEALQARIAPAAGWLHGPVDWDRLDAFDLAFHPDASRFRLGTMNNVGVAALDASLALYEEAGPEWCEGRVLDGAARLADGLDRLSLKRYGSSDPAHASGIVTVEHDDVAALQRHLEDRGIETAVRQRKLRFSPTYYNSHDEIDGALAAVDEFMRAR